MADQTATTSGRELRAKGDTSVVRTEPKRTVRQKTAGQPGKIFGNWQDRTKTKRGL
jgi:hypothetical protein